MKPRTVRVFFSAVAGVAALDSRLYPRRRKPPLRSPLPPAKKAPRKPAVDPLPSGRGAVSADPPPRSSRSRRRSTSSRKRSQESGRMIRCSLMSKSIWKPPAGKWRTRRNSSASAR